jgi:hypothetical protein
LKFLKLDMSSSEVIMMVVAVVVGMGGFFVA